MSKGAKRIAAERNRQTTKLGWTAKHDDEHDDGSLALVAICYAAEAVDEAVYVRRSHGRGESFVDPWPDSWDSAYDARRAAELSRGLSRDSRVRFLEKAGALLAAEIDRLLREVARGE